MVGKFGEISNSLQERASTAYRSTALKEVQAEFPKYFDALKQHPRLLVGTQVPSIRGEGMETLRDSADAQDWQAATKQLLMEEVEDRANRSSEANRSFMETLHQSIDLFQRNADLVPGTREFDRELADQFVELVRPYEVRVDGKLHGYSVPVQPMVDQLRKQIISRRAAAAATPPVAPAGKAAPAAQAGAVAPGTAAPAVQATPPADGPQAGIQSKAGASTDAEDYSTLWGTLGLPPMRL